MTALFCCCSFFFSSAVKHFCPLSNRAGCILFELTSKQLGTSRFIQQDASYIAMRHTCKCKWRTCKHVRVRCRKPWKDGAREQMEVKVKWEWNGDDIIEENAELDSRATAWKLPPPTVCPLHSHPHRPEMYSASCIPSLHSWLMEGGVEYFTLHSSDSLLTPLLLPFFCLPVH